MVYVAEQVDQYLTRPQCTLTILSHFKANIQRLRLNVNDNVKHLTYVI